MSLLAAFDAVVARGGAPAHADRVLGMRRAFEARTGAFGPEDPWFEARSRAFWDDAVTHQGFASHVAAELPEPLRPSVGPLGRAHRGLFRVIEVVRTLQRPAYVLEDVLGGAHFVVDSADPGTHEALESATGVFDARLVASEGMTGAAMLPGAVFHPEDATNEVLAVVEVARARGMIGPGVDPGEVLDGLLRMERALRSHSRVRPSYAYRAELLVL